MPRNSTEIDRDIQAYLGLSSPRETLFRVEILDHGRASLGFERDDYRTALRDAKGELLGAGGDLARIYLGRTLVAEGRLQRRAVRGGGQKFSVSFVGEKPAKPRR